MHIENQTSTYEKGIGIIFVFPLCVCVCTHSLSHDFETFNVWINYLNCNTVLIFVAAASCPPPLVFHDCFQRECEPNCNSMKDTTQCPAMPGTCIPGCFCPDGLVRKGDKCVKPIECRDCEYSSSLWSVYFLHFIVINVLKVLMINRLLMAVIFFSRGYVQQV